MTTRNDHGLLLIHSERIGLTKTHANPGLGPMQEARRRDLTRPGVGLACAQIPIIGQDDIPLLVIHRERVLRHRVGKVIQRRIDS